MGQKVIFNYNDVLELKQASAQRFSEKIHFHDGCGGQYFSLDESNNELQQFITDYYSNKSMRAVFSKDGLQFIVERV